MEDSVSTQSQHTEAENFKARFPKLSEVITLYFAHSLGEPETEIAESFAGESPIPLLQAVTEEAGTVRELTPFPWKTLGEIANRTFGDANEARRWLRDLIAVMNDVKEVRASSPGGSGGDSS